MSFEMMAPLMFAGLVVFLLLGYPVAFSLAATGLFFGLIGMAHGSIEPALLQALPERVLGIRPTRRSSRFRSSRSWG